MQEELRNKEKEVMAFARKIQRNTVWNTSGIIDHFPLINPEKVSAITEEGRKQLRELQKHVQGLMEKYNIKSSIETVNH